MIKARRQIDAIINKSMPHVLKVLTWPDGLQEVSQDFLTMYHDNFSNIVGAIGGYHTYQFQPPVESAHFYLNRKTFNSIILQDVFQPNCTFSDLSIGCARFMHDSNVLKNADLWMSGHHTTE